MRYSRIVPLLLLLLVADPMGAQTNLETNAGIQFNFSTPGAANLAMGGAFLALADDATAAYTNPAGLTQVLYQELHFEARAFAFTHVYTDKGRLIDPDTCDQSAPPNCVVDYDNLESGKATDRTAGASFLSYVHRWKRFSTAVYRHELARFEANFDTLGARIEPTRSRSPLGIPGEPDGRLASLRNTMDLLIVNYGTSAAWLLHPRFSVGAGLSYYEFSIDSRADRYVPDLDVTDHDKIFGGPIVNVQTQTGVDNGWSVTLGMLWEHSSGKWRIGGVFRDGSSFDFQAESKPPDTPQGTPPPFDFKPSDQTARFHVPRFYGIGLAYLPSDAVRITLDFDRIFYSDLIQDIVDIFGLEDLFENLADLNIDIHRFVIEDAEEIHIGFEYYFRQPLIALRAGAWYDPDHSMYYDADNRSYKSIFRQRRDEVHYTFGVGISRQNYQIHLAVDLSDRISTGSLSAVLHF